MPSLSKASQLFEHNDNGLLRPLDYVLGVRVKPLIVGSLAMLFMALLVRLSSKSYFLGTELPHSRNALFDFLYLLLEPTILLALTIVPTFMIIIGPRLTSPDHKGVAAGSPKLWATAILLSLLTLGFLISIENLLKQGLARARPVARTEHFIIAAALDGTLSPELAHRLTADLFECPIGRALFATGDFTTEHVANISVPGLSSRDVTRHIRSIRYREGIGPYTFDLEQQTKVWPEMAGWRQKHIEPILMHLLHSRKLCDLTGATPSGHVLRQGFVFFLFLAVLVARRGPYPWRWPASWTAFFLFQLFSLIVVGWSRLYGYDHSWSDELVSIGLTVGVLAVGRVVHMIAAESEQQVMRLFSNEDVAGLMHTARVMLTYVDRNDQVLLWNAETEAVTGFLRQEVPTLSDYVRQLYPHVDQREAKERLRQLISTGGREINTITEITTKSGLRKLVCWNSTAVTDDHGRPIGKFSFGTELNGLERRFAYLGLRATATLRNIRQLIYPLTTRDVVNQSDQNPALSILHLCDSVSKYTSSGGIMNPVDLRQVIDAAFLIVQDEADSCGLRLQATLPSNLPPAIGDEALLSQLLAQVLLVAVRNAKQVEHKRPIVIDMLQYDSDNAKEIRLEVTWQGPDLPLHVQDGLRGNLLHHELERAFADTSIDLFLVRIAAVAQNGNLQYRYDKGSVTITLLLPAIPQVTMI
jgi:PAS domain S-box-containing protein